MIQYIQDANDTALYRASDTMGIGDMLLGGLTNPFTGKPSSQAQQWMTIVYAMIVGVVLSALYFKSTSWFKKLAKEDQVKADNKAAYVVGRAEGYADATQARPASYTI